MAVRKHKIALILPAYNEALTIGDTIRDFHKHIPHAEFIIVDNNSSDDTGQIARDLLKKLKVKGRVLYERRQGKAMAMRTAFREIEADYYVLADADMTYPAADIHDLLQPVIDGEADMTVGDRISKGKYKSHNQRRFHFFGNKLVITLINYLFRSNLSDIMSGYRALNRVFVKNFPILSRGFEIETEMTLHALDKNFRVVEVPTDYRDRPEGSFSKLNTLRDGALVLQTILWVFKDFKPLFFFGLLSSFFALGGLVVGAPVLMEFINTRVVLHVPSAILATGLMIISLLFFAIGLVLDTVAKFQRFNYELAILKTTRKAQD